MAGDVVFASKPRMSQHVARLVRRREIFYQEIF